MWSKLLSSVPKTAVISADRIAVVSVEYWLDKPPRLSSIVADVVAFNSPKTLFTSVFMAVELL